MRNYLAVLLAILSLGVHAETSMECASNEVKNIAKFPIKAKRLTEHVLLVSTSHSKVIFKDKPPYDENFPLLRWEYCAYSAAQKMHLVLKDQDTDFSGILLDDITGKQLPAGQDVIFSDDGQMYVAFAQPDGLDGREMIVYQRDGRKLWQGFDFIEGEPGYILANFDEHYLHWNKKNQLQGMAVCLDGKKFGLVTLSKQKNDDWAWLPKVYCSK